MSSPVPPLPADVAAVLDGYAPEAQTKAAALRELIHEVGAETAGVGPLLETLKWGEPAFLTQRSGSGTTVRIAWKAAEPDVCRVLFNCRTSLVEEFRQHFGERLTFEGNRAIVLPVAGPLPEAELRTCIRDALTYKAAKRGRAAA